MQSICDITYFPQFETIFTLQLNKKLSTEKKLLKVLFEGRNFTVLNVEVYFVDTFQVEFYSFFYFQVYLISSLF